MVKIGLEDWELTPVLRFVEKEINEDRNYGEGVCQVKKIKILQQQVVRERFGRLEQKWMDVSLHKEEEKKEDKELLT
jgi:hypothetical protein